MDPRICPLDKGATPCPNRAYPPGVVNAPDKVRGASHFSLCRLGKKCKAK